LDEGIKSTVESFNHFAKDSYITRHGQYPEQSKMDKLLGGGKVADILLWRDEKETFVHFLALAVLFYWFFLSGRTFASSAPKLLLVVTVVLYGYGFLPSRIFGFTIQEMSASYFEISEAEVRGSFRRVVYLWNKGVRNVKSMAKGEDWNSFFKVTVLLYFLKKIIAQSLTAVAGVALVFSFTGFFVYEQYEAEIDQLVVVLFNRIKWSGELLMRNLNLPASAESFLQERNLLRRHNTLKDQK
jgi:sterol-4alpha-carboxylate 3-dehydrogenase (decarboxylating)